jgi:Relaxase/Mobilisation nuclease domain
MIGKQFKRNSFSPVLRYVSSKEGAQQIGGNMAGQAVPELIAEFQCARSLNPSLRKPVYHVSLSLPHPERLSDQEWGAIAHDYLKGMGFDDAQYVVYRHQDREHDHVHLVASRIRLSDGSTVSDSWNYHRSQALLRQLEVEYGLTPTPSSWEVGDRSLSRGEREHLQRTGEASGRYSLQVLLKGVAAQSQTLPEYVEKAQAEGITIRLHNTVTGVKGISYGMEGVSLSGTQLGRAYTLSGLAKYYGIDYEPQRDDALLEPLLSSQTAAPIELPAASSLDDGPQQYAEQILPIALRYFGLQAPARGWQISQSQEFAIAWDRYRLIYHPASGDGRWGFRIEANDGRGELVRSHRDESTAATQVEAAAGIGSVDVARFEWLQQWMNHQQQPQTQPRRRPRRQRQLVK